MRLNKKLYSERTLFVLFLVISIFPLFIYQFHTSLDGPQHLYNSNVIVQLLKGNELFQDYFKFNPVIVGYWMGHFFLSVYNLIFPALIAEKLFIISFILGMAFSFRYLVSAFHQKNTYLSLLIFPFIFSMYFMMGYYTFCIAFIFYFLLMGFYVRNQDNLNLKNLTILGVLFLLVFFSHAFVFALSSIALFIYFLSTSIYQLFVAKEIKIKDVLLKAFTILLSTVPALLLWYKYITHIMRIDSAVQASKHTLGELFYRIVTISQISGFIHETERIGGILITLAVTILLVSLFIAFIRSDNKNKFLEIFNPKNTWFLIAFVFLLMYFFLPNRISAGNLTHRVGLFFWANLIAAIAFQKFNKKLLVISISLIFLSHSFLTTYRLRFYERLNRTVKEIRYLEPFIEPNSTLYTLTSPTNWIENHFLCYLGIDKTIVNTKNPQNRGQFPVVWNYTEMPRMYLGSLPFNKSSKPDFIADTLIHELDMVDYIAIFNVEQVEKDMHENIRYVLDKYFTKIAESPKKKTSLYRMNDLQLEPIIDSIRMNINVDELKEFALKKQLTEEAALQVLAIHEYDKQFYK